MGGEGVAQAVDADAFGDAGFVACGVEPLLDQADIDRNVCTATGKQPDLRPIGAPVQAQGFQQLWRQQAVAIARALALLDAQRQGVEEQAGLLAVIGDPRIVCFLCCRERTGRVF
jgi:hypothetical protein